MTWIILLAAVGITLISLEVIIPGGILGAIGVIGMLAACVLCFSEFGGGGGLLGTALVFSLTGGVIWLEFRLLSHTRFGKRAFLTKRITAVSSAYGAEARDLIGKAGVAKTTLAPSGYILIGGVRHEAFSESGLIEAGTALTIVGADNFRLIVAPSERKDYQPTTT